MPYTADHHLSRTLPEFGTTQRSLWDVVTSFVNLFDIGAGSPILHFLQHREPVAGATSRGSLCPALDLPSEGLLREPAQGSCGRPDSACRNACLGQANALQA